MTKIIDARFVGKWQGCDDGKVTEGEINYWKVTRTSEGKFEIYFETHYNNGIQERSFENGFWYVENHVFYEYRESDEQTDAYKFEFISSLIIQFIEMNSENEKPYFFKDYKVFEN